MITLPTRDPDLQRASGVPPAQGWGSYPPAASAMGTGGGGAGAEPDPTARVFAGPSAGPQMSGLLIIKRELLRHMNPNT